MIQSIIKEEFGLKYFSASVPHQENIAKQQIILPETVVMERSSEYKVVMACPESLAHVEFCVFNYKTAKPFGFVFKP